MKGGKVAAVLSGATLLFLVGFTFRDVTNGLKPNLGLLVKAQNPAPFETVEKNFSLIDSTYYRSQSQKDLKYAAMEGLMASLGDPHTIFLPPVEKQDFDLTTTAQFVGIGCELSPDPGGTKIADIFPGSPAEDAGLKAGDVITAVNGKSVAGTDSTKIVDQIRGPEGSTVLLTVQRPGVKAPLKLTAKREAVFIPTVRSKYLAESKVGYVSVASFSDPTADQFDQAINQMVAKGMKGLIIDLRGNPGGLLNTALTMLGRFDPNKTAVTMKTKDGGQQIATTDSETPYDFKVPIAILINQDSASAAEIFSGVMHDYGLATLIGEHSYGKASVQRLFPLLDGAGVKVTIAHYFLPFTPDFSRKIDDNGIYVSGGLMPDVKVEEDPTAVISFANPATDRQLAKAIEFIQHKETP